ncbi:MAG: Fic family protein [Planctomycetes bacterium]|nr:Fic family protein [Planctomycetota bacterium]
MSPSNRAGEYVVRPGGYRAFIPKPLPPNPPLNLDDEFVHLLSLADRAVGRLDASTINIPDPDFFVYMYVIREAELSSQIEGTQATLSDVLEVEAEAASTTRSDVNEIFNYVDAMNHGLERLREDGFPLSLRLIREIHATLLQGVRGESRQPGEFRTTQNWIGPEGCDLQTATFIPPPPNEMNTALNDIERFFHDEAFLPALVRAGFLHAQFETIHPFHDGNGRIGRLLITLFLCKQNILRQPLLYLSHYFRNNQLLYYNYLQAVRDTGDWEAWIKFFLRGVYSVAQQASLTARKIIELRENHRNKIQNSLGKASTKALVLLEKLYRSPIITIKGVTGMLNVSYPTAMKIIGKLSELEILVGDPRKKRGKIFRYTEYQNLFTTNE